MNTYATALVTGASSGIGAEMARQLAARGSDLIVIARHAEPLERMAFELQDRHGVEVEVMIADLADENDVRKVESRIVDPERPVDLVVNNAGRGIESTFFENDREDEAALVKLNVLALFRLTHAALTAMIPRGRGGILNVSSVAGDVTAPGTASYCASKAFVTSLGQSLHMEAKPYGVHVTTVLPGFVRADASSGNPSRGLPAFSLIDGPDLVREALDAVESGKVLSVPTVRYKLVTALLQVVPRNVVRTLAGRVNI